MKIGIYSSGNLWGTVQIVEEKIQVKGDKALLTFISRLYKPQNQSLQEFVASLPSRLHGRVYAEKITNPSLEP